MGLVFDKIHFPNVFLPAAGYDAEAVRVEADRIAALGLRDYNTVVLVSALRFLPVVKQLEGFCKFTGFDGQIFGDVDKKGTSDLVRALDEKIFGPPKPGFMPTYETGFHKGLPGCDQYIDYPGSLHYPATAIAYSARNNLPLINDNPSLPVPALGGVSAKDNAKLLTAILALECAGLVLPKIRVLQPQELMELREDLAPHLRPFRLALLRLSAELNKAISSTSSQQEIVRAARFIVETDVQPTLLELKAALEAPSKRWYSRAMDATKQVPELVTSFATMPTHLAIARALSALGGVLVDIHAEKAERNASRSGMYYLLKLSNSMGSE